MNPLKLGASLSKCIPDIVNGVICIDDVAMIITGTAFEIDRPLPELIDELMFYYEGRNGWPGQQENERIALFRQTLTSLFSTGRIHQPRKAIDAHQWSDSVGWNPVRRASWWDVRPAITSEHPLVKDAWENYRNAIILTGGEKSRFTDDDD